MSSQKCVIIATFVIVFSKKSNVPNFIDDHANAPVSASNFRRTNNNNINIIISFAQWHTVKCNDEWNFLSLLAVCFVAHFPFAVSYY